MLITPTILSLWWKLPRHLCFPLPSFQRPFPALFLAPYCPTSPSFPRALSTFPIHLSIFSPFVSKSLKASPWLLLPWPDVFHDLLNLLVHDFLFFLSMLFQESVLKTVLLFLILPVSSQMPVNTLSPWLARAVSHLWLPHLGNPAQSLNALMPN